MTRVLNRPWLRVLAVTIAVAASAWSFDRVPNASWGPAALGMLPWIVGKYVLCPLRWHAISTSGRSRRWHLRSYAESELLGLMSPGHIGADLWRVHRLEADAAMGRTGAVAEVALDRLIGAVGLTVFVVLAGATLPPQVLAAAAGIAVCVLLLVMVLRRWRPGLFAGRPLPSPRVVLKGVGLSVVYQMTIIGLLMGTIAAMGQEVSPVQLLAVFGASQVAGIVPGIRGASPREGALVLGLTALGISWQAAVGAVALTTVLAWLPGLMLGGTSLVGRRLNGRRAVPAAA